MAASGTTACVATAAEASEKTANHGVGASAGASDLLSSAETSVRPPPPSFWFVFDWRLLVSLALLGLIGVMSCDVVNSKLNKLFADKSERVPDPSAWKVGTTHEVDITLITKDEGRLDCSDDREFDGVHCAFKKDRSKWPVEPGAPVDDNRRNVIQPYRTAVGNHLLMVAGMWATPALAFRHHQESPRGMADANLKRFVARCQLEFVGELSNVDIRWNTTAKWYAEKQGPVARAKWCEVVKAD